jgi:NADH dehydrogenase [ubiquinone] 1 alpha subcomplex assembly factor 7
VTPLERLIRAEIAAVGPMTVARYMELCLAHPRHGYYATRDPLGAAGDFVTAPEISQMFGEMVGVWVSAVWEGMGRPAFRLVELGPGRGTLMADALRVLRAAGAAGAAEVWLVETSAPLRAEQAARVPGARWAARLTDVPEGPAIVLANEFLDALPVRQFLRSGQGWRERMVGLAPPGGPGSSPGQPCAAPEPALRWGLSAALPMPEGAPSGAPVGAWREVSPAADALVAELAGRLATHPGALLVIDYGYRAQDRPPGPTLQSLRRHAHADPLECPGEADLTWLVDFDALARGLGAVGAQVAVTTQGAFLARLGIGARAAALARAHPDRANEIADALARLTGDEAMGRLFKVAAAVSPGLPAPPGCEATDGGGLMEPIVADALRGVTHGFFTRQGGVSAGVYESLNGGPGSGDDPPAVAENRGRVARRMGVDHLLSVRQVHGSQVARVTGPWEDERPSADAMVTDRPGIGLAVLTADCAPVLMADARAGVVGAAHAGWRGALEGVLEATVAAMQELGAERDRIVAAIGPTISQRAYEVGPEFVERFLDEDPENGRFFAGGQGPSGDRAMFDLPGFCLSRLRAAEIGAAEWTGHCTYGDPRRFFSYRRTTHRGGADYGRLVSAIAL